MNVVNLSSEKQDTIQENTLFLLEFILEVM